MTETNVTPMTVHETAGRRAERDVAITWTASHDVVPGTGGGCNSTVHTLGLIQ